MKETKSRAVRMRIFGRVQGVFFRSFMQEHARRNSIAGWVRNESGGTVSAFAQGERKDVNAFIEWTRHGPPTARVERVELGETSVDSRYTDFEIR